MKEIYKITWRDISPFANKWVSAKEAEKTGRELFGTEYTSVGVIAYENEDFIVVSASWVEDEGEYLYNDLSMIPRTEVLKIELLKD